MGISPERGRGVSNREEEESSAESDEVEESSTASASAIGNLGMFDGWRSREDEDDDDAGVTS